MPRPSTTACAAAALLCAAALTAAAQGRAGSIYDPTRGPGGLIAEKTAFRKGDILTVVISESQNVSNQEASALSRETSLDYRLSSFDIKPGAFNPLPSLGAESADSFNGQANYTKAGRFQARLAVIVVDTLPNGNMVISGRREIRIDKETKLIEITGIVRRYDIRADNTVQSELVANAEVVYRGSGPMTRATNRYGLGGALHSAIAWLWPF